MIKKSFTIHDLPESERPRERLLRFGVEALNAQELIALILGRGTAGESVYVTAQNLLTKFGSLNNVAEATIEQLDEVKGIGQAKATQLKAACELAKRLDGRVEIRENLSCRNPADIAVYMQKELRGKKKEHFLALLLDTRNRLQKIAEISVGSLDTSIVHPREVFKEAISNSAACVIFVHNHPSGDCTPSAEDIELTKRLIKTGEIIGIDVLDHIIVSDKDFLSMKSRGLI